MSTNRHVHLTHIAPYRKDRGPHGRRICRGCDREVPAGRRTWCSLECAQRAMVRAGDPGTVARLLFVRDKGICALCGADADLAQRVIARLYRERWSAQDADAAARLIQRQWGRRDNARLWEADHTVPVVEGGGLCGLDGYRTLCRPCHVDETAKLATRRAEARNPQRRLPLAGEAP